ncbi:MAG: NUDIX hydrolase [Patescibacteria group bacterium]
MISPWTLVGERVIQFKKYGKSMVSQMFLSPKDDKEHEFILYGERDYAMILPLTDDNKVIAVRQYRHGCNQIALELPAGCADVKGESALQLINRELLQETGYVADRVISLGDPLFISTSASWTKCYLYLGLGCKKVQEQQLDDTEDISTEFVPLDEWVKLCLSSIVDLSSVAATFRSLPHLKLL